MWNKPYYMHLVSMVIKCDIFCRFPFSVWFADIRQLHAGGGGVDDNRSGGPVRMVAANLLTSEIEERRSNPTSIPLVEVALYTCTSYIYGMNWWYCHVQHRYSHAMYNSPFCKSTAGHQINANSF